MLRNREVRIYLLSLFVIIGLAVSVALYISIEATLLVAVLSIVFVAVTYRFTVWRYREIDRLSSYLQEISNGNYKLDVRDNLEGELSLLKSQIYKVTKMLSEQGTHLEEDKQKLTDAISDISHQLKTPLTSMTVMADLLSDPRLSDDKRQEFTHNVQVQLERMEWLVSSLLKLSKIDAGTIQFKREPVSIPTLVQAVTEPMLVPIDIKMQRLQITGERDVAFEGDMKWTTEALINILKNCVEHTPEQGELFIDFSENTLYTEIIIRDTGSGIAKQDVPYIFQRFYKGMNASDDSVGIGLAMAHSIITSQQGELTVRSERGAGTAFQIRFYKAIV
ncbi:MULTISPECIES: sensor histidine kinase [Exiguobacterium]|uniref:sensor histidine kinase n=1 Tax=Exiguobacterium TaxID=33986 RepID=UPI001BE6EAF3|nr:MULTISPECIES: HAMP domain-containing sensor histidine kinase [Exiguobacterium]MCT4775666.1 HAMP domain-containing histidine kinase [Exiguobacterium aquaticum]MCT4787724.1 HAMP domain-containing histidine kinase [Exiguobacterium mexicanum]